MYTVKYPELSFIGSFEKSLGVVKLSRIEQWSQD